MQQLARGPSAASTRWLGGCTHTHRPFRGSSVRPQRPVRRAAASGDEGAGDSEEEVAPLGDWRAFRASLIAQTRELRAFVYISVGSSAWGGHTPDTARTPAFKGTLRLKAKHLPTVPIAAILHVVICTSTPPADFVSLFQVEQPYPAPGSCVPGKQAHKLRACFCSFLM